MDRCFSITTSDQGTISEVFTVHADGHVTLGNVTADELVAVCCRMLFLQFLMAYLRAKMRGWDDE